MGLGRQETTNPGPGSRREGASWEGDSLILEGNLGWMAPYTEAGFTEDGRLVNVQGKVN